VKKILGVMFVSIIFLALLSGCSDDNSSPKTEEQLKSELKAEIQAEMEAEQNTKMPAEQNAEDNGEKSEESKEQEKAVGPTNIAIKNYEGKGLEKLAKIEADTNVGPRGVQETLAIFGEVTNVKVEKINLNTEANQRLLDKFDSLKNVELAVPRDNDRNKLIAVSFYDKGLRKHVFTFTSSDEKDYIYSDAEGKQKLVDSLDEKYKKSTSYEDQTDLVLRYLGLTGQEFLASNNFNSIPKKLDMGFGEIFYRVENEPLGNTIDYKIRMDDQIFGVYITPSEQYNSIKDNAKSSFFGVDFDMPIYQARYNLDKPNDEDIFIDLIEKDEKLVGINITPYSG